jgi:hypothetical protein
LAPPDHIEIKLMFSVMSNSSKKPLKNYEEQGRALGRKPKTPTILIGLSQSKELRKPKVEQKKRRRFPTSQEQTFDFPFTQDLAPMLATCGSMEPVFACTVWTHMNGDHPFCL